MAYRNARQRQAELTINVMPDHQDARQRQSAAASGEAIAAYPLGDPNNLTIKEQGLLFGWKRPVHAGVKTRGARMPLAFETLNGLQWGQYQGGERELEDRLIFLGVANTDKNFMDANDPNIGVAATTFGGTSFNIRSNTQSIHPGDDLSFSVPRFHTRRREIAQADHTSYARDALVPVINPVNWGRLNYYLEDIYGVMMSNEPRVGVYDLPSSALHEGGAYAGKGLNPDQRAALALRHTTLMTAIRAIEELALRGLVTINSPAERQRQAILQEALAAAGNQDLQQRYNAVQETDVISGVNLEKPGDAIVTETHQFFKRGLQFAVGTGAGTRVVGKLRTEQQQRVLYLAALIGAVEDRTTAQPMVREVQNDILQSVFGQFSTQVHNARIFTTTVGELARLHPDHPLIAEYVASSENFATEFQRLAAEGYHSIRRTIIGMAFSYVPPNAQNAKCDIGVSIHGH